MRKKILIILSVFVIISLFLTNIIHGEPIGFKYKWKKGQEFKYKLTSSSKLGNKPESSPKYMQIKKSILNVDENNVAVIEMKGAKIIDDKVGNYYNAVKYYYNKYGQRVDRNRIVGSDTYPANVEDGNNFYFFPIFSSNLIDVGGQWTVNVVVGLYTTEGLLGKHELIIKNTFQGFQDVNGISCAKVSYQMTGSYEKLLTEEKDYENESGNGEIYFDLNRGFIVKNVRHFEINQITEKYYASAEGLEPSWHKTEDYHLENNFTYELIEVINPGN